MMENDKKKAALRAKNYVLYRRIKTQRMQVDRYIAGLRVELSTAEEEEKPDNKMISSIQKALTELNARVKILIASQKRARNAATAPRYRIEGRVKGGARGRRTLETKRQKSTGAVEAGSKLSSEKRVEGIGEEDVSRIDDVHDMLLQALRHRDGGIEQGLIITVVQLLMPLTGLPDGAVLRENLPPENALLKSKGYVGFTVKEWAGRQDIDIVALFRFHRQRFEQLFRVLTDGQLARVQRASDAAKKRLSQLNQQIEGLNGGQSSNEQGTTGDASSTDPPSGARQKLAQQLADVVNAFNDGPQNNADYSKTAAALKALLDKTDASTSSKLKAEIQTAQHRLQEASVENRVSASD